MSAYLNTRVSLYSERLWSEGEFTELIHAPHAEAVSYTHLTLPTIYTV